MNKTHLWRALIAGSILAAPPLTLAWSPYPYGYGSGPWPPAGDFAVPGGVAATPTPSPATASSPPPAQSSQAGPSYPGPSFNPHEPSFGPGYGPDFAPGYGPDFAPGFGPDFGFQPPPMPDFPAPSFAAPDRPDFPRSTGPIRFNQRLTQEGYVLEIPLNGLRADEIQVDIDARSIRISRDTSAKESREDNFDNGRGYMRRFSYSSGRSSRRLPLPQDADASAMRREDSADMVRIIIPRRQG